AEERPGKRRRTEEQRAERRCHRRRGGEERAYRREFTGIHAEKRRTPCAKGNRKGAIAERHGQRPGVPSGDSATLQLSGASLSRSSARSSMLEGPFRPNAGHGASARYGRRSTVAG